MSNVHLPPLALHHPVDVKPQQIEGGPGLPHCPLAVHHPGELLVVVFPNPYDREDPHQAIMSFWGINCEKLKKNCKKRFAVADVAAPEALSLVHWSRIASVCLSNLYTTTSKKDPLAEIAEGQASEKPLHEEGTS